MLEWLVNTFLAWQEQHACCSEHGNHDATLKTQISTLSLKHGASGSCVEAALYRVSIHRALQRRLSPVHFTQR